MVPLVRRSSKNSAPHEVEVVATKFSHASSRQGELESPTSLFIHNANRHAMDEDYDFASDEAPAGLEGLEDGDGRADDADASG